MSDDPGVTKAKAPDAAIGKRSSVDAGQPAAPGKATLVAQPAEVAGEHGLALLGQIVLGFGKGPAIYQTVLDLDEVLFYLRGLGVPIIEDIPTRGRNLVVVEADPTGWMIATPSLKTGSFTAGSLSTGPGEINGFVMRGTLSRASTVFKSATFEHPAVVVGGQSIRAAKLALSDGVVDASTTGLFGASVRFGKAELIGVKYPGSQPIDLTIVDSSFVAIDKSVEVALARMKGGPDTAAPPVLPKIWLDGTRIVTTLERARGSVSGGADGVVVGGLDKFEAQLIKEGSGEPGHPTVLASLSLAGVYVVKAGDKFTGGVAKVDVSGDPSLISRLRANDMVKAEPEVMKALEWIEHAGLVPLGAAKLSAGPIQVAADAAKAVARTDLSIDVPLTPGALHIELIGAVLDESLTAPAHAVDFKRLVAQVDGGKTAALELEGSAQVAGGAKAGAIRTIKATGDVKRIVTAARHVPLPPRVAAIFAGLEGLDGRIDLDAKDLDAAKNGAGQAVLDLKGRAHARVEIAGVGALELDVSQVRKDATELHVGHFTARLVPGGKSPGEAASLTIEDGHLKPGNDVQIGSLDLRGDLRRIDALLGALQTHAKHLGPEMLHAVELVRKLDIKGLSSIAPDHPAKPGEQPGAWRVRTNAHCSFEIPKVGTVDVDLHGFDAAPTKTATTADFESFEITLTQLDGKRTARIHVAGGHGYTQPALDRGEPADFGVDLDQIAFDGEATRLARMLSVVDQKITFLPAPIAAAFRFVRAHARVLAASGGGTVSDVGVVSADGGVAGRTKMLEGRARFSHGTLVARLSGGYREREGENGFETLELGFEDHAAWLVITDGRFGGGSAGFTSARVEGNGPKLLEALDPKVVALLPAEIAEIVDAMKSSIVAVAANGGAVESHGAGHLITADRFELSGWITIVDERGTTYESKHPTITAFGARAVFDHAHRPVEIDADRLEAAGDFKITGSDRKTHGDLRLRTGKATVKLDGKNARVHATDIRAAGTGASAKTGKAENKDDHQLRDLEDTAATARTVLPGLRELELDVHVPLRAGRYEAEGLQLEVASGNQLNVHLRVSDNMIAEVGVSVASALEVRAGWLPLAGARSVVVSPKQVHLDVSGLLRLLEPVAPVGLGLAKSMGLTFDIPGLFNLVMPHFEAELREKINEDQNWANAPSAPSGPKSGGIKGLVPGIDKAAAWGHAWGIFDLPRPRKGTVRVSGDIDGGVLHLSGGGAGEVDGAHGAANDVGVEVTGNATSAGDVEIDVRSFTIGDLQWHNAPAPTGDKR